VIFIGAEVVRFRVPLDVIWRSSSNHRGAVMVVQGVWGTIGTDDSHRGADGLLVRLNLQRTLCPSNVGRSLISV
jgi:hypothetical protein